MQPKYTRERAEECFLLPKAARDPSTRSALERLGYEMLEAAEELEPTRAVASSGAALPATANTKRSGKAAIGRLSWRSSSLWSNRPKIRDVSHAGATRKYLGIVCRC